MGILVNSARAKPFRLASFCERQQILGCFSMTVSIPSCLLERRGQQKQLT